MTDKDLMQEALDALTYVGDKDIYSDTIDALRARLSQPEPAECDGGQCGIGGYCKQCPKTQPEQEPVAWGLQQQFEGKIGTASVAFKRHDEFGFVVPLYTAPPKREWVGLTHEEHMEILTRDLTAPSRIAVAEAKLKEKNG